MHFSISEFFVILLVAILVIKPERLPEILKEGVALIKSMKNGVNKLKQDIFHESSNERKF